MAGRGSRPGSAFRVSRAESGEARCGSPRRGRPWRPSSEGKDQVVGARHRRRSAARSATCHRVPAPAPARPMHRMYRRPMAMDVVVQRLEIGDVVLADFPEQGGEVEATVVRDIDRTDSAVRVTFQQRDTTSSSRSGRSARWSPSCAVLRPLEPPPPSEQEGCVRGGAPAHRSRIPVSPSRTTDVGSLRPWTR